MIKMFLDKQIVNLSLYVTYLYFYIHSICFQPTVIHFHRKFIHIQRDRVPFLFKLNDDMMQCNEDIKIIYLKQLAKQKLQNLKKIYKEVISL